MGVVDQREEEVPAGYKRTEVGVIPEEWRVRGFSELFDFLGGHSASRADLGSEGPLYLHYGDIHTLNRNFVDTAHDDWLPRLSRRTRPIPHNKYLIDGDVVFVDASEDDAAVSKYVAISNPACIEFVSGLHTTIARSRDASLSNQFKCHCFSANYVHNQFVELAVGTKVKGVSKGRIGAIRLAYPIHSKEQTAIATALSDVDALLASLDAVLAKRRAVKRAAMQRLLSGEERLPGFDGKWAVRRLGEVFNLSGGTSASRADLGAHGDLYLHYGDIHGTDRSYVSTVEHEAEIPRLPIGTKSIKLGSRLKTGDVVFVDASEDVTDVSKHVAISNPNGATFVAGLHTIVASEKDNLLDERFKRYCFRTYKVQRQFEELAVGTKVKGVSKGKLGEIEFTFPPLPEQRAIAAVLGDLDAGIAAVAARRAKVAAVKAGMMGDLLTGRVRLVLSYAETQHGHD